MRLLFRRSPGEEGKDGGSDVKPIEINVVARVEYERVSRGHGVARARNAGRSVDRSVAHLHVVTCAGK